MAQLRCAGAQLPLEGAAVLLEAVDGEAVAHRHGRHLGEHLGEPAVGPREPAGLVGQTDDPRRLAGDEDRRHEGASCGGRRPSGARFAERLCKRVGEDGPAGFGGANAQAMQRRRQAVRGVDLGAARSEEGDLESALALGEQRDETRIRAEDRLALLQHRPRRLGEGTAPQDRTRNRPRRNSFALGALRCSWQSRRLRHSTFLTPQPAARSMSPSIARGPAGIGCGSCTRGGRLPPSRFGLGVHLMR